MIIYKPPTLGSLHSFWNLDAEKCHTVLQDLSDIGSKNQTGDFLCLALSIQDAVVVIELVELLGQLVAVVGNTSRVVVVACIGYGRSEVVHLLDEVNLFLIDRCICAQLCWNLDALGSSLAHDAADTSVGVLDERTCVAIEVDTLFWVEEHVLAGIYLEDEVLQRSETHDA